ncbi:transglycosylase domain-containing protein [Serpentinicella alkaliphila]|uniref:Penicillin-binding protein 1A n=1 Tax=Serpentinicella alkaliphila TaxID=1734049 RepID=A0A4R2TG51_9FIRM|nr:PBP1A family penicillin-binding protein [Serpentinicella alkaliphila]QUH26018.1 PBP1A family penicillin-binding protein [Serpentinicella alkaliphila]TCQ02121.1 penicillin-binding protein 1A [Serpentinicella alkaliphila]
MTQKNQPEKSNDTTNKKRKKNKFKILRTIILFTVILGVITSTIAGALVIKIIKTADPIDAANIYELLDESSLVLDSSGQVLERIQREGYRDIVNYSRMPEHLREAFVAIEDERFWSHNGLDFKRIFGALWTNLRTGSKQGASTINQQLAKNLFLEFDQTYERKIKDMYYGVLLDRQLSKPQILEAYLNTINLGSGAYGVQAAAQIYFSKDVEELTLAESAMLAGITRNPASYPPFLTLTKDKVKEDHYILDDSDPTYTIVFRESALNRQKLVLKQMRKLNNINEAEYQEALAQDIKASLKPNRMISSEVSSYFGDLVKSDVIEVLKTLGYSNEDATNMLFSGGLRISSTVDKRIQMILEEEYSKPENFPTITAQAVASNRNLVKGEDGIIRDLKDVIQPQSAMVIIDYNNGEIKGLIGGREVTGKKIFNRATDARQPGSSIKPIAIYAPAIERGFTAASVVDDVRVDVNGYRPHNFDRRYRGLVPLRTSLNWSSNVVAVRLGSMLSHNNRASILTMHEYIEKFGVTSLVSATNPVIIGGQKYNDENLSLALGGMTRGISPLELTAAYGTIANEGVYIKPVTFTQITDKYGNIIYENKPNRNRVITPQTSYLLTSMLQSVVTNGTGGPGKIPGFQVAGKTGTTNDKFDVWFAGYTPHYSAALWIGSDNNATLTGNSSNAARLWQQVMARVHQGLPQKNFPVPDGIIHVDVCSRSGKLPTELCSRAPGGSTIITEAFVKGAEPTEYCDVHVLADIHVPSGKLATEFTPPWEIEQRVFIKRPVPFNPAEFEGYAPDDAKYELPKSYYDPFDSIWNGNNGVYDSDNNNNQENGNGIGNGHGNGNGNGNGNGRGNNEDDGYIIDSLNN